MSGDEMLLAPSLRNLRQPEGVEESVHSSIPILKLFNETPLAERFKTTRTYTEHLVCTLSEEDQCVQSMPDASPIKWHLGHTTWFFEKFILTPYSPTYKTFNEEFSFLFNSYYESLGPRQPRPKRGLLTRPSLSEVMAYRHYVTEAFLEWTKDSQSGNSQPKDNKEITELIELGINHEQQHQELMITDALHLFSCNPFLPASKLNLAAEPGAKAATPDQRWIHFNQALSVFGHDPDQNSHFSFDNEQPVHQRWLEAFEISDRLVSCGEFLNFIEDGGYQNASLWLSEGWAWVNQNNAGAPAYWVAPNSRLNQSINWCVFGVNGLLEMAPNDPVTHLNFFEADAFAQWAHARLPTEFEWERAFEHKEMRQMLGSVWQWTRSAYEPYPGFKTWSGAIGEYNGKFMVGQQVLRGSSWATPPGHDRKTYRNFFPPTAVWQITGLRLARDCK